MYVLKQVQRLLAVVAVAAAAMPAAAQEPQVLRILDGNRPRTFISVTGEGEAAAPPDMATIRTGVVTQAATAKEALNQNNAAMITKATAMMTVRPSPGTATWSPSTAPRTEIAGVMMPSP